MSKNTNDIQLKIANRKPVQVSFEELIEHLPQPPKGWIAEKFQGETIFLGNYSISQVSQIYTQQSKQITIRIFDWAFNSALYTPFLMTTDFSQESTEGYNKSIKIDNISGKEYTYSSKRSLNLLVYNKFFVQIEAIKIEKTELREWWQLVDYKSLIKLNNN
ncbi:hypothetical protein [Pleurocapsa sp. FMAR1]|uniref:hypothetical protein n=1 Tax=Pleurocapsa sp. FMAR1 TaxID=3040204 RepID=UPI0029C91D94|nr:hypothetical protein [Pleurocapsa sp. FMAR1]